MHVAMRSAATVALYSGVLRAVIPGLARLEPKRTAEGALRFPFVQRRRSARLQILAYHRVHDHADPFFPAVTTRNFARQMEHLATHYTVLALEDAVERMTRRDLPENGIVVTFDDGYRDNYTNALPALRRYAIPATVFVATGVIGTNAMLWHDRVFDAFRRTSVDELRGFDGLSPRPLRSMPDRIATLREVLKLLRSLDDESRRTSIMRLVQQLEITEAAPDGRLMLSWDEIRTMRAAGIGFGSHTVSHPILSHASREQVQAELSQSKKSLEDVLGAPVTAFAYPSGRASDFDEATKRAVAQAGYRCAVTAIFGTNAVTQDLLELRRGGFWHDDLPRFAAQLAWSRFVD